MLHLVPSRAASLSLALALPLVLSACEEEEDLTPVYANVERVIDESCAFSSSCHGGDSDGEAMLNFAALLDDDQPITDALVGVESCEYSFLPRVDPGNPEGSWLYIKLTAPQVDNLIQFTPDPEWDPGLERRENGDYPLSTCPLVERDNQDEIIFGAPMPLNKHPRPLAAAKIEMIRQWIEMGALGPDA